MSERDDLKDRLFELGAAAGRATNERESMAAIVAFTQFYDQHFRAKDEARSLAAALNQHPDHD